MIFVVIFGYNFGRENVDREKSFFQNTKPSYKKSNFARKSTDKLCKKTEQLKYSKLLSMFIPQIEDSVTKYVFGPK